MRQQRLENAALQPQPKFEVIKRHYRHGVFGRSKTDCPVEIECMGGWKAAYEAMMKEGGCFIEHVLWDRMRQLLPSFWQLGGATCKCVAALACLDAPLRPAPRNAFCNALKGSSGMHVAGMDLF